MANLFYSMIGGQGMDNRGRGRGRGRGGMRGGRGRGGHVSSPSNGHSTDNAVPGPGPTPNALLTPIVAPQPTVPGPAPQISPSVSQGRPDLTSPECLQSPTPCKFRLICTNAVCRYSHPSPVATPVSFSAMTRARMARTAKTRIVLRRTLARQF